jgi:hypothetical protein
MRKDPDQRFQSAVDLRLALEDLQGNDEADTTPSIAVLPFSNLSPDKENEYFSDGAGGGDHQRSLPRARTAGARKLVGILFPRQGRGDA